jgi:hypothetical protein
MLAKWVDNRQAGPRRGAGKLDDEPAAVDIALLIGEAAS